MHRLAQQLAMRQPRPPVQLLRKQNIRQLRLAISPQRLVPALTLQILEIDLPIPMCQRRHRNHPRFRRSQ